MVTPCVKYKVVIKIKSVLLVFMIFTEHVSVAFIAGKLYFNLLYFLDYHMGKM